ncbi:hypothetical protein AMATHDRAFT_143773 [Amanita thiersii Skay4041]|uniref:Uncharacterized protein n=1 Tax=Amanita thiersii Skay4041 TaxID=703135 RepID=A0A2A9NTG7_9AGAR|nr:hypothetical protein AMATHDRAFT_143773 [Amanita thiersii Skay4041]
MLPSNLYKPCSERPRGLWKARVTAARISAKNVPDRKENPLQSLSDTDDADDSSCPPQSPPPNKKHRKSSFSDSSCTSDEDEVYYWDYSRRCTPNKDRVSRWTTRTKIMDTSTTAGGSMIPSDRTTCDLDDWEDLKELFAKAAEQYETDDTSESLPLLRGVIHECHRFLLCYPDPSVLFAVPATPETSAPEAKSRRHSAGIQTSISPPATHKVPEAANRRERKCRCIEVPTAFHAILGTALFLFGNLIASDPSLALEGEPTTPVSYWLAALDVFETGENLPSRTSGSKQCDAPEDWRMALVWGRTLVCLADEVVHQQIKARQEGRDPATVALDVREPNWPPQSPFSAIAMRRPPVTRRMSFDTVTPNDLLVLAMDQFSRGIFHMPHPTHRHSVLPASSPTAEASSSKLSGSPPHEHFSRAKELYTIGSEVLLVAEKLEVPSERHTWACWADSVFNQMKMEADRDGWRKLIFRSRGRCWLVAGSAFAEELESALERGEVDVLKSDEAADAREGLSMAVTFFERAKAAPEPGEEVEDPDAHELQPLLTEALLTLANLTEDQREREKLYGRAKLESGMDLDLDQDSDEDMLDATTAP